ncbi:MAG: DUF721 domain-containing protein [Veillonella sp.]|uniref:DUF721 domain-containing protein n=1 Tax=Veillonella sp. TaxID=1926307 RepID=UPI0025F41C43|nr:DUF721 domain-containing protein [Veillonella sp.]MBS4913193.1 DUF721 domain-containing protein [Veillonella sp.]
MRNHKLEDFNQTMDFIMKSRSYDGYVFYPKIPVMKLYYYWSEVVGKRISQYCNLIAIKPPVIVIGANTSAWLQQLQMSKPQLIKKINEFYSADYSEPVITDIKLEMNKRSTIYRVEEKLVGVWEDFRNRERIDFAKIHLTDEDIAEIDANCAQISSESMRKAFREAQIKQYKKRYVLTAKGYHPCPSCGLLIEAGESLCISCTHQKERILVSSIQDVLFQYPYWKYDEMLNVYPRCTMEQFNEAKRNMIYYFLSQIRAGSTDNYDLYMATMLITCKTAEQLSPEFVVNLTNKYRKKDDKNHTYQPKRT